MIKKYPATLCKLILLCSFLLTTIIAQAQMKIDVVQEVVNAKKLPITKPIRTTNNAPIIFSDNGTGVLVNGSAEIEISPEIINKIDGEKIGEMIKLSIQMEGESNGIYISKKNRNTFIITELLNGSSSATFSYKISVQAAE